MKALFLRLRHSRSVMYIVSAALFATGIIGLAGVLMGIFDRSSQEIFQTAQETIVAIMLMYLSVSLHRRIFSAWLMTIAVVAIDIIISLAFAIMFSAVDSSVVYWFITEALLIATLLYIKPQFKKRSDRIKISRIMYIALGLLVLSLTYGTIGHMVLTDESVLQSITFVLTNSFYTFSDIQPTPEFERLLFSTQAMNYLSFALILFEFIKPLVYRSIHTADSQGEQMRMLLEQHGGSSEDYFKLWPADKEYLFNHSHSVAIAYKVVSRIAIAVGDPVGNRYSFNTLIAEYKALCLTYSLQPVFLHTTNKLLSLYKKHGFKAQKLGEEAVVDIETFITTTSRNKKWRNVNNRFIKSGYALTIHHPPHSDTLIDELKRISDEWLETPGRKERGFVLGYFDKDYLSTCSIGVLRNNEAQIVGFVNLITSYDEDEANIDLFRQRSNAVTNTNDFMMSQLIVELHTMGFTRLNLGLCPLVGLDDEKSTSPLNALLTLVYAHGDKLYSFKGLHQFKSKFDPTWRSRYLIYQDTLALPTIGRAINKAMDVDTKKK